MQEKNCIYTQRKLKMARNKNLRIKVEGVEDILKALRKADEDLKREMHNIVAEAVEIVFREADAKVKILSVAARDSFRIDTCFRSDGLYYANVIVYGGEPLY